MPDDKKNTHPETFFLPPLNMLLSFFDPDSKKREPQRKSIEEQKESREKTVVKLIEKLNQKENP